MAARPWMDDGASPHCLLCHQAFSFTNRRHHCRSCARLVCGACSSRSMRLESIQRPSSSIRNVGTQLAKTTLATAASMVATDGAWPAAAIVMEETEERRAAEPSMRGVAPHEDRGKRRNGKRFSPSPVNFSRNVSDTIFLTTVNTCHTNFNNLMTLIHPN